MSNITYCQTTKETVFCIEEDALLAAAAPTIPIDVTHRIIPDQPSMIPAECIQHCKTIYDSKVSGNSSLAIVMYVLPSLTVRGQVPGPKHQQSMVAHALMRIQQAY